MSKLYRLSNWSSRAIKSILALIAYRLESFNEHYRGPDLRWAVDEYMNWLKWEYKAGNMIDPYDAREKLWEFISERGAMWD